MKYYPSTNLYNIYNHFTSASGYIKIIRCELNKNSFYVDGMIVDMYNHIIYIYNMKIIVKLITTQYSYSIGRTKAAREFIDLNYLINRKFK